MNTLVSTARRRRRAALAAMLALAGLPLLMTSGAEGADSCIPNEACLVVKVVSTADGKDKILETRSFSSSDIVGWNDPAAPLVTDPPYYTRSVNGKEAGYPRPSTALPLRSLLSSQKFETEPLGQVRFSESDGTTFPTVLGQPDFGDPKDPSFPFEDNLQPAIYTAGGAISYVRPLRDKNDINSKDRFTIKPGQTKVLKIHTTGKLLEPLVTVGGTSVNTKTTNRFGVTLKNPGTRIVKHTWTFGDGTNEQATYEEPRHRYTKRGTYFVQVEVRGRNGSYGRSAAVKMKVGNPPKPPKTDGSGGSGGGSGDGIGGGGSGSGYIPPFVPNSPTIPSDGLPNEEPPIDDFPTAPVDDGLEQVEGFVLAGAGSEQGESIPGTDAAAQPTEASELSTTRKISGAAIGALAVLLLLGLGAEIETRWLSTRLGHLRRRA